jgi:hypothetical protein
MQLPWPQQLSNVFENFLEFNPEKFPIFLAELSRGRHDRMEAVFGLYSNAIAPFTITES